jgi:methionine-rich copper-binding protein CopC
MRKILTLAVSFFALLLCVANVSAHAMLDHAEPRVGNIVKTPPRAVTLWFTQNLEPAFSAIEVRDASGARVDTGKTAVDRADRKVMRVGLKPLRPGTYTVRWHVLSVDTHQTEGDFSFRVE